MNVPHHCAMGPTEREQPRPLQGAAPFLVSSVDFDAALRLGPLRGFSGGV